MINVMFHMQGIEKFVCQNIFKFVQYFGNGYWFLFKRAPLDGGLKFIIHKTWISHNQYKLLIKELTFIPTTPKPKSLVNGKGFGFPSLLTITTSNLG